MNLRLNDNKKTLSQLPLITIIIKNRAHSDKLQQL